jgi:hypothetical protein
MNRLHEIHADESSVTCLGTTALPSLTGFWTFVGDIHGRLQDLPKPGHPVVQVGDIGIGFIREDEDARYIRSRDDLWFIRGNSRSAQSFLGLRQPAAAFRRQPAAVECQPASLHQTASATAKPQSRSRILPHPTPAGCRSTKRCAQLMTAASQRIRPTVGRVCVARVMSFRQHLTSQHRAAEVTNESTNNSNAAHSRAGYRHTRPTFDHPLKLSTEHLELSTSFPHARPQHTPHLRR